MDYKLSKIQINICYGRTTTKTTTNSQKTKNIHWENFFNS